MGYYSENIEYISKVEEAAAKYICLKGELGLANSSENDRDAKLMLNFCETKMLLHIADDLKRIADSLEKLASPLSFYEDKGVRKREENKEDDTK